MDEAKLKELKYAPIVLPKARLINNALWELQAYEPKSPPNYSVQVAFDPDDVTGSSTVEDKLIEFAGVAFGVSEDDYLAGKVYVPFRNGDELADARAENGKPGDAYRGKLVLSARTQMDRYRQRGGAGGVAAFDAKAEKVEPVVGRDLFYNGCYVILVVTLNEYRISTTKQPAISFRLSAVQFAGDGERLGAGEADFGSVLSPIVPPAANRARR